MKWKNKGHEFDEIAKNILKLDTKYMIWGAGKTGQEFLHKFKNKINIVGIIDSAVEKIGEKIDGYDIVSFENFKKEKDITLIITIHEYMFDDEIIKLLKTESLVENQDYIYYSTYNYLYNMYIEHELRVPYIRIPVTERCTLRCQDCISRMTEFKEPKDYLFDEIISDIDAIFKHIDYVENFRFVGGEPFLNKKLIEVVDYVGKNYFDKVGAVVIVSNGTILPSISFFEIMNKYGVVLRLSNYENSREICNKQKINQIRELSKGYNNIKLEIAIDDGIWHKYSINKRDIHSEADLINYYDRCICSPLIVKSNRIYACVWHAAAVFLGELEDESNDFFDLKMEVNDINKYILMEFLLKFTKKGYINGCKYCYGEKPIHHRFIEAAIQKK